MSIDILPSDIFNNIPDDIFNIIYSLLDPVTSLSMSYTNLRFKKISKITIRKDATTLWCCQYGYSHLLIWAIDNNCPISPYCYHYAAKNGYLELMMWMEDNCQFSTTGVELYASEGGHIPILEHLNEKAYYFGGSGCIGRVARRGHIEAIRWLLEYRIKYSSTINASDNRVEDNVYYNGCRSNAIEGGHINILEYLVNEGRCSSHGIVRWSSRIAELGHLHILQWFEANNYPWKNWMSYIQRSAARCGKLNILQWIHNCGHEWTSNICIDTGRHGLLVVLKWLVKNDAPWNAVVRNSIVEWNVSDEVREYVSSYS